MARINKKLHIRKNSTVTDINLYSTASNVGPNYIKLEVDSSIVYAQVAEVGATPSQSSLRVKKNNTTYAVNAKVEDPDMIDSNRTGFIPGVTGANMSQNVTALGGTYYGSGSNVPCTWYMEATFGAPPDATNIQNRFTIRYSSTQSDLPHHYRLLYGTTSSPDTDGGLPTWVISSTSGLFNILLYAGTYYFKVVAEDAANNALFESAVSSGLTSEYTTKDSLGTLAHVDYVHVADGITGRTRIFDGADTSGSNNNKAYWSHSDVNYRGYYVCRTYQNKGNSDAQNNEAWISACADTCTCNCNYCSCNTNG